MTTAATTTTATKVNASLQSLEGEEATLGAMLASDRVADFAIEELVPDDFLRPAHQIIFSTIMGMRRAGEPVDHLTVIAALKQSQKIAEVGGPVVVMTLAERVPAVSNYRAYVREVKDVALMRELVNTADAMADDGRSADPASARHKRDEHPVRIALEAATARLISLRERVDGRTFSKRYDIGSLIDDWGDRYQREVADPDASLAIPFPSHLPQLNAWTMGQRPGRLIVSSGFTGHGKSWFGLDCSETVMQNGGRVAYFALELPGDEILERLIGMGGISYAGIQQRAVEWSRMEDRINAIGADSKLLTVLDGTTSMHRIETEIIRARVSGDPYRYAVVDTINLLDLPGRASDRRSELDKALMRLKNLAIDHGLTIHAQAQLNRDKNRDAMDPPTLANLKESSGIEQTADLVLFVHRLPGVEPDTLSDVGKLVVAKGRNIRRRGRIEINFDSHGLRFMERGTRAGMMGARSAA
jgi:replicative DNA helicase